MDCKAKYVKVTHVEDGKPSSSSGYTGGIEVNDKLKIEMSVNLQHKNLPI